jgi:DNA-directed RNA polymerase subunit RPC12/RpoP
MARCPGQDTQFWKYDAIYDIKCPQCGGDVEFFKDEVTHRCRKCGVQVLNEKMDLACLKWCPHAEQCVGPDRYKAVLQEKELQGKRDADFKRLLELVPETELDVRNTLKHLYYNNKDLSRLFDTNELFYLKEKDEKLFEQCMKYYRQFIASSK